LPLGHGATLSQPFVVAAMLGALELLGGERVLDVGSGSGYTTALLCELAGAVHALERVPELADRAAELLHTLDYRNFSMQAGDGWAGLPERFPFDGILVSAAVPGVPPVLLDQLSERGRLVAPVGGAGGQILRVIENHPEGRVVARDLFGVRFVPLLR